MPVFAVGIARSGGGVNPHVWQSLRDECEHDDSPNSYDDAAARNASIAIGHGRRSCASRTPPPAVIRSSATCSDASSIGSARTLMPFGSNT